MSSYILNTIHINSATIIEFHMLAYMFQRVSLTILHDWNIEILKCINNVTGFLAPRTMSLLNSYDDFFISARRISASSRVACDILN